MESVSFAEWDEWGSEPVALAGSGATMRQVYVPAGRVAARHSHSHEQFLRVISGAGELQCETGSIPLRPGIAIRLASNAWHSATFSDNTVLLEINLL